MMDSALLQNLAAYYRAQADVCCQRAQQVSEDFSQGWLHLAEKWIRLAQQVEVGTFPNVANDALM
jgi:hypothetical protein